MASNSEAPGLKRRRNKGGSERLYWHASKAAKEMGYRPVSVRIHAEDEAEVAARCQNLQAQMEAWLRGKLPAPRDDGTYRYLFDRYETDPYSPFHKTREKTQEGYLKDLRILRRTIGHLKRADTGYEEISSWYAAARAPRKPDGPERIRSSRGLMVMLRTVLKYGTAAEIAGCRRLKEIILDMRFEQPKPRTVYPTYDQVLAVIAKANEMGILSIALGMALQFETCLRQYDVTGWWERAGDDEAAIMLNKRRWCPGLTWGHIGPDNVLRYTTSKRQRNVVMDLSLYPLITAEIARVPQEKRVGPMVIDERSGLPYADTAYGKRWREVADAAGIPKEVWNRDARAGGLTEAGDAGASKEDMAKQAAHPDGNFTATVYDRGALEASRRVAEKRRDHRAAAARRKA